MKILQVITSLNYGGAEKLISEVAPLLQDRGNVVDVCSFVATKPNLNELLVSKGIKVINFSDSGSVYNPSFIWKLIRLMKGYDVVHTHNTACQMFAALGSYFSNSKMLTTEHSTSTRRRKYKLFKWIDKWMYSRYDRIICISEPAEKSLRNYIGDRYPIVTIRNGVNIQKFMDALPVDLGLGNAKIITMVAGFRYEKDQPTAIKAMMFLPSDYHLLLVGDGIERTNIEMLIANLKLHNRVHLLGLRNDVPNILKASDVIVMSSHREGLSLSNVEGMSSGHPFVASDVEGLREVTDGYGVLFPHGDAQALAHIIEKLCTDEHYAAEVAAKCQERAKMYDIQRMVDDYNNVYLELTKI